MRAMQDAWRAYLELALGLTEASRKKATKVAKQLVGKGGATAEQLQNVAEELVKTSVANREAMTKLVRYELDRALGVVGLATAEEVADLTARVRDLEQQLREAEARPAGPQAAALVSKRAPASQKAPAVKKAPASKKAATKTAVAKKTVAKKTVARKAGTP
jgi:polyhydroxyalkanoate synthesis regulator phasin